MKRDTGYFREMAWRHALRKKRISDAVYSNWWNGEYHQYYPFLHQFSKNKIHCSCPLCSAKTRNKGKRKQNAHGFSPAINYKPSDLRKVVRMDMDEAEFKSENFDFSENL